MIATIYEPSAAERVRLDALEAVIRRVTAGADPADIEVASVGYYLECLAGSGEPYDAASGLDRLIEVAARYKAALTA